MSCSKLPVYILQQLPDLTECIKYPIKNVQRVKYTCFDVSKRLIAFGAISGGIYVFNRNPCEFLQLIPNKDGAITRLAISPDEKHIAFANGRGVVTVTRCDQSHSGGSTLQASKEHQGNEVTAIIWSRNNTLFAGDDIGKISVMQLQNFITKTFQSSSQTIMSLDSRICQLDTKDYMLLVSTLTRSYICDTSQEQYRQIGQKLRDGEYGACFVNRQKPSENSITEDNTTQNFTEIKKYNIIDDGTKFPVCKDLENTLICCARPSSRLWEASIDGTVRRTHQFKQVLASKPMKLVSVESYSNATIEIESYTSEGEGQSVNFPKVYSINNIIMSYKKDALYFLDIHDVDATVWYDTYKDIIDCKIYNDFLYLWLSDGSFISLRFMKIDKFLARCYIDEKFELCAKLCALYSECLLSNNISPKVCILSGLRDKLQNNALLKDIENVLQKIENLKSDATQMRSGIYIVDNTFNAQTLLDYEESKKTEDTTFGNLAPETLQTLKELSVTVTDKLNSSKKVLKGKWEDLEEKMKHLGSEKQTVQELTLPKRISVADYNYHQISNEIDNDIIYKESSQKAIDNIDSNILEEDNKVCKSLYQYFRLSLVGKEIEQLNLIPIIESNACDIKEIYNLMLLFEKYCLRVGALEESKYVPNKIFLTYLNISKKRDDLLDEILTDETLYKYFIDSCISVNMKTQKLSNLGCECGFPLPFDKTNQTPAFCELIDDFIERQWTRQTRDQCYEICKRMPYLWRKIIHLRRNEDLLNVLRLILQMLDEDLLHSFLPQFTTDTWDTAIQLYATLHANTCLNCNKKFDHISVKEMLSWDDLGALIIKSVGGTNAIRVMEKHAKLIETGGLTMKFYHTCLLVTLYDKYDSTITTYLTDAIYDCYEFEDSRKEVCNLLRSTIDGEIKNTALPIAVAANTSQWGLSPLLEVQNSVQSENESERVTHKIRKVTFPEIIDNLAQISGVTDCILCGLPLQNAVLVRDGGIWAHRCGHVFHGACLDVNKLKLCPSCSVKRE